MLEPEAAATVITQEQTILTLALILDTYVKQHSSSHSNAASEGAIAKNGQTPNGHAASNGHETLNGNAAPNNLMRAVRVAQIVAEVAKIEVMRELCVECG